MKHGRAYELVAKELERWRDMPYEALSARVGMPAETTNADVDGELISIEVKAEWLDASRTALRVCAIANGPSTWRLERTTESIVVRPTTI